MTARVRLRYLIAIYYRNRVPTPVTLVKLRFMEPAIDDEIPF